MVCSRVLVNSLLIIWAGVCCSGGFPFSHWFSKQKQYPRSRENFSPCNFTRAIPQGKKEKLPLSLQMLLHQKKLLKTSPADSNAQLSMYILIFSLSIMKSFQFCLAVITKGPVYCTEIQHEVITCYFRYIYRGLGKLCCQCSYKQGQSTKYIKVEVCSWFPLWKYSDK